VGHGFRRDTWQVLSRLVQGEPVDPQYYPRSIRAIAHAWQESAAEAELIERLTSAVTGEETIP
jgi:hypothetical protein